MLTIPRSPSLRLTAVDANAMWQALLSNMASYLADIKCREFDVAAISSSTARAKLVLRCAADGVAFFDVKAANVLVMDEVQIGSSAIFMSVRCNDSQY